MKQKVVLVTEYLNPPYDEGIKKTAYNLFLELDGRYETKIICRHGFEKDNIEIVKSNALFLSGKISKKIRSFNPGLVIYFPFASATFASYLRLKVLKLLTGKIQILFIILQPKPLKNWQKVAVRVLKPESGLTPSPELKSFWDSLRIKNQLLPLFTDLQMFHPVDSVERKIELREKYNLPKNKVIISHMGHLNEGRNLRSLVPLQDAGIQVVVVGSSSTPRDSIGPASLKRYLEEKGFIILDRYIENIAEIYQLSDIYVFPVKSTTGSIGMPLSVLEARACGIPVITTDFGSLKQKLGDDFHGIFYSRPEDFKTTIEKIINNPKENYIKTCIPELNEEYRKIIHNAIEFRN